MRTKEQEKIIQFTKKMKIGDSVKINAKPGTGKTFTLVEIAKEMPEKTFLYLAFNKSIEIEAKRKFPKNTKVFTTHALALWALKEKNPHISYEIKMTQYNIKEIEDIFNVTIQDAKIILHIYTLFLNTEVKNFDFAYRKKKEYKKFATYAKTLFDWQVAGKIDITHDVYLKFFQLMTNKPKIHADYVLLDEAQDTNKITWNIFKDITKDKRSVLVGDEEQQIYGFRGSVNVMSESVATRTFNLTITFRCNQEVCNLANTVIKLFKPNKYVPMKPFNVIFPPKNQYTLCYITRTNSKLINYIKEKNSFNLVRDPKSIFSLPIALFNLNTGNKEYIPKEYSYLKKYNSIKEIEAEIEENDLKNVEITTAINIVRSYGKDLFTLLKKAKNHFNKKKNQSNIYLSTAHTSKGLEFDRVVIEDDFPNLVEISTEQNYQDFLQEVHLAYVAITRAKYEVTFKGLPMFKKKLKGV